MSCAPPHAPSLDARAPLAWVGDAAWVLAASGADPGYAVLADGGVQLSAVEKREQTVTQRLDGIPLRGRRVEISTRLTFAHRGAEAAGTLRVHVDRIDGHSDAWDTVVDTRQTAEALHAVIDVSPAAASLTIALAVTGPATATFERPRIEVLPRVREQLETSSIEGLVALARMSAYVRFFHPSDEAARADWPRLIASVVEEMLEAPDRAGVVSSWTRLLQAVAPTATLGSGPAPLALPPPATAEVWATRWIHVGFGDNHDQYAGFRVGLAEPSDIGVELLRTASLQGCTSPDLSIRTSPLGGQTPSPTITLMAIPRRGAEHLSAQAKIVRPSERLRIDAPPDASHVLYGLRVGGFGAIAIHAVELRCGDRLIDAAQPDRDLQRSGIGEHLYRVQPVSDPPHTIEVSRSRDLTIEPTRDHVSVDVGLGLRLHMPTALWTDGAHTYPVAKVGVLTRPTATSSLASRLAVVIDIWSTLSWFHPYVDVKSPGWESALRAALVGAASASSSDRLLIVVRQMIATLRDAHVVAYRRDYDDGLAPIRFQRLGDRVVALAGIEDYAHAIPGGAEVRAIDGSPIEQVLAELDRTIPAPTPGWRAAYTNYALGEGHAGTFFGLTLQTPDGATITRLLPRVDFSRFVAKKRPIRPPAGSELAPGIVYADATTLDAAGLEVVLAKLAHARAVIYDLRGGVPPVAFRLLAYFTRITIPSPTFQVPVVSAAGTSYSTSRTSIVPREPTAQAELVFLVNGETASAPETILSYARAAHIGTLLGETTAGTNGDVTSFTTLGGIRVRFTGLRMINPDGTSTQGTGFAPDIVVHPTLTGVIAGRDEILDAAVQYLRGRH